MTDERHFSWSLRFASFSTGDRLAEPIETGLLDFGTSSPQQEGALQERSWDARRRCPDRAQGRPRRTLQWEGLMRSLACEMY